MSNESKPQEWFHLQNDTWNGPFKTSRLKELVKSGIVGPNTLLRLGIDGVPFKAHQVKSLFPNYQVEEQAGASSINKEGILSIIKDAPTIIGGVLILVFLLGLLIFGLSQSDKKTTAGPSPSDKKATADSSQNGFKGASENSSKPDPQMPSKNVSQVSLAEGIASIEKQMVIVPAGRFMMGDQSDRLERFQVTITKPFYMGKYEVTQEQWESVMGNNPSEAKSAKLPVTDVSWEDCQDFIKKLNAKTNGGYRLPTEAEWEYACRAGTTTAYSFGDSLSKADANYGDRTAGSIKPVGTYKPNAFGLYDMHGNVMEWCNDWFDSFLQKDGEVTDRKGPATGDTRVLRGGSFIVNASGASSFTRIFNFPTLRVNFCGFRLARTADTKTISALTEPKADPAEVMPEMGNLLAAPFTETKAKEVQKSLAKSLQKEVEEKEDLGKGVKLDLVLIPAGKFMMGSPVSEKYWDDDETQHEVTLTKPFYMGKYEVTQEQWESVMKKNPSDTKGAKLPVTNVSWEDCQEFIKKLNAKTDGGYRLPTEAEWEHACRAGTSTAYSYGDSLTKIDANIDGNSIKIVGSYKPNAFGLYDMHGNVWEWCNDRKADYRKGAVTDPMGPATGETRVLRGGSSYLNVSTARSSYRFYYSPTYRFIYYGFRLARTADTKTISALTEPKADPAEVMPEVGNLLAAPFTKTKAKEVQKSLAKSLGKEFEEKEDLGQGIKLDLVLIPAGKFIMGSPANEKGRSTNEKQHEVTITKPYCMGKYEVTQEQWEAVMGDNPSKIKGKKLPVTNVSWNDCQEFIRKLNAKAKGGYRLPTESEWEYACRAGTSTAYSYGDSLTKSDANISGDSTKPVGSYKPNAFGLYDMHGNVWEWCNNWYGSLQDGEVTDPNGPATGENRVLRGGSFLSVGSARSSLRYYNSPSAGATFYGFRLARTP